MLPWLTRDEDLKWHTITMDQAPKWVHLRWWGEQERGCFRLVKVLADTVAT